MKCGGIGHYARDCPSKGKGKQNLQSQAKVKAKETKKEVKGKAKVKESQTKEKVKAKQRSNTEAVGHAEDPILVETVRKEQHHQRQLEGSPVSER